MTFFVRKSNPISLKQLREKLSECTDDQNNVKVYLSSQQQFDRDREFPLHTVIWASGAVYLIVNDAEGEKAFLGTKPRKKKRKLPKLKARS